MRKALIVVAVLAVAASLRAFEISGSGVTSSITVPASSSSSCLSVDSPLLIGDCSSDRIGIGTSAPGTKLHMSSGTLTVDGTGAAMNIAGSTFTVTNAGVVSAPSQPFTRNAIPTNVLTVGVLTKVFFSAPAAGAASGGMWGGTSSSGTFTIPALAGGKYSWDFKGYINGTGAWIIELRVNGTAVDRCYEAYGAVGSVFSFRCSGSVPASAADTIEVFINQPTATESRFGDGLIDDNFTLKKELH